MKLLKREDFEMLADLLVAMRAQDAAVIGRPLSEQIAATGIAGSIEDALREGDLETCRGVLATLQAARSMRSEQPHEHIVSSLAPSPVWDK